MSESKPKIKDLFGISTAEHVQVEGEPNETVPDFEARTPKIAKIVTNQTVSTSVLFSRHVCTCISDSSEPKKNKKHLDMKFILCLK